MAHLPYNGPRLSGRPHNPGKPNRAMRRRAGKAKSGGPTVSPEIGRLLLEGTQRFMRRDYAGAGQLYAEVLRLQPNQPDALNGLGTVGMAAGESEDAIRLFNLALGQNPSDPTIHRNLGAALLDVADLERAEIHLRKALKLDPSDRYTRTTLGNCKLMAGEIDEARKIFEDVLRRKPDYSQAIIAYADLCVTVGDVETARDAYRSAVAKRLSLPRALAGIADCEQLPPDSAEALEIGAQLQRADLTATEHADLHRAAGGIADRGGRYDDAFRHFAAATRLAPPRFDADAHRARYAGLRELFTQAFFAERSGYGHPSERPVFIVGMPRSGTTLTEQIISSHPDAAGGGELQDIPTMIWDWHPNDPQGFAERVKAMTCEESRKLAGDYLSVLARISPDSARITDKLPHNFENLGVIALLFPNARIVHCTRDPRDTCVSCYTTPLVRHAHPYTQDLAALGAYYREYVSLMDHWRAALPLTVFECNYEQLVGSLEEKARELIDFLSLPWNPACLNFHESKRAVITASRAQVRQPLYSSSVARWRRYETHLGPLLDALGDLLEPEEPAGAAPALESHIPPQLPQ